MTTDLPDIVTQAQLGIGSDLMQNVSMATRICKTYMDELKDRLALGGSIEPGPLTFIPEHMCVGHTYC